MFIDIFGIVVLPPVEEKLAKIDRTEEFKDSLERINLLLQKLKERPGFKKISSIEKEAPS